MGRRRNRMRLRGGAVGNITQTIENASAIAKKVVVDKDKALELEISLQKIRMELLHSGKGASITKITICGLVALVVGTISYKYMTTPAEAEGALAIAMTAARDYAISVTPVIAILIGVFGTKGGKTLQGFSNRIKKRRNRNKE